jgi:plasmid maintenance system antidote protein VapI
MAQQAVAHLGVSRKTLSMLLNGHAGISPETLAPPCPARTCQGARSAGVAVRLSQAFGRTPQGGWQQLQMHYDLAQARQQVDRIRVTRRTGSAGLSRVAERRRATS